MKHVSIWRSGLPAEKEQTLPLTHDIAVDVAVVGGGITGLSAALLLVEAGLSVAVVEAMTIGSGVSSHTTAHATQMLDTRYYDLEHRHGLDVTRVVAASSAMAIARIEQWTRQYGISSGFLRRPGYLFTERDDQSAILELEHDAANRAGLGAQLLDAAPVPFATRGALRVRGQAQFHAGAYLAGLARTIKAKGALIFEGTRVTAVEDGETCHVHTEDGATVRARAVFIATHAPTVNRLFLQTKIAAYRSYAVACPGVKLHDGLFWDMDDPYHYFSSFNVDGVDYLVAGGEDHKTGKVGAELLAAESLRGYVREHFMIAPPPIFEWSAQVEEPVDGLPFIGKNSASKNVYVATGFSGNGITFGTLAAMIVADAIRDAQNSELGVAAKTFAATRIGAISYLAAYLQENVDYPLHLLKDRFSAAEAPSVDAIASDEGKVLRVEGRRLAVYRDVRGDLHAVSAICTHLGCVVHFNRAERSWDCPCHGSRFDVDGKVLDGPAAKNLVPVALTRKRRTG